MAGGAAGTFRLAVAGEQPVAHVLRFLAEAEVRGARALTASRAPGTEDAEAVEAFPGARSNLTKSDGKGLTASALPAVLAAGDDRLPLSHWLEGDGRATFKTFAGQQVGMRIAANLLNGDPKVRASAGVKALLELRGEQMQFDPFSVVAPTGGSFNFDARGAWDALGAGTSLDAQGETTRLSPLVDLLAALGLQNARPVEVGTYALRYMVWNWMLPPVLARPGLALSDRMLPHGCYRSFSANMGSDKYYKKFFFADEETPA